MKKKISVLAAILIIAVTGAYAQLNVGGTARPNSTLQVSGSVSNKVSIINANTTLDSTHNVVYVGTTGLTLTLPSPVTYTGRQYIIRTNNTAGFTTTLATPAGVFYASSTSTSTTLVLNAAQSVMVVADGTNWLVLSLSSNNTSTTSIDINPTVGNAAPTPVYNISVANSAFARSLHFEGTWTGAAACTGSIAPILDFHIQNGKFALVTPFVSANDTPLSLYSYTVKLSADAKTLTYATTCSGAPTLIFTISSDGNTLNGQFTNGYGFMSLKVTPS